MQETNPGAHLDYQSFVNLLFFGVSLYKLVVNLLKFSTFKFTGQLHLNLLELHLN